MNIISKKLKDSILFETPLIKTPYHDKIYVTFADFIASSRPSPLIENYISKNILPYYSNTHSNSACGIMMKNLINDTKNYIRQCFNIDKSKKIIFTGTGTTCAINHLVHTLKLESNNKVNIFLSPLEHHSNYLPWIELTKKHKNILLHVIPVNTNFEIDINYLENKLKENSDIHDINIVTLTACSNVLGIKIPIEDIYNMIQKYNDCDCCYGKRNLLFVDYACSAPYVKINNTWDAAFMSLHKFLGGVGTPGLLIGNKDLFHNTPFTPGGGCVKSVKGCKIEYDNDIEKRETAGTPNIIGIIKIKKVLQLKKIFFDIIENNEKFITQYVFDKFKEISDKNNDLIVILPDVKENRLPIVCIAIKNVHYNLVVVLLNDLFGIQIRGGVFCTGLLADLLQKKYNVKGWCRISFNWLMDMKEIDYIINTVKYILHNHNKYVDKYSYDEKSNLFMFKK